MNKSLFSSNEFPGAAGAHRVFDFGSEAEVARRGRAYEMNRRDYFRSQGWKFAIYALDLLLETTKGKMRNDGVTPEWIHSARPTEWPESLIKAGLLDRALIERHYGSLEIAVVDWLLHDLGENEGITPHYLMEYFQQRLQRDADAHYTQAQYKDDKKIIDAVIRDFKLLTNGKNGEIPFNVYLWNISESGYAFLVKLGDRLDNMATFVGLQRPDWDKTDLSFGGDKVQAEKYFNRINRYNQHTYENFAVHDLVGMACQAHPHFAKAYHGMDCVMGFLFRINYVYTSYHPFNPKNDAHENKRVVLDRLVVDVSKYWDTAVKAAAGMHHGTNPMEILWNRIGEEAKTANLPGLAFRLQTEPHDRRVKAAPYLYEQISNLLRLGRHTLSL